MGADSRRRKKGISRRRKGGGGGGVPGRQNREQDNSQWTDIGGERRCNANHNTISIYLHPWSLSVGCLHVVLTTWSCRERFTGWRRPTSKCQMRQERLLGMITGIRWLIDLVENSK